MKLKQGRPTGSMPELYLLGDSLHNFSLPPPSRDPAPRLKSPSTATRHKQFFRELNQPSSRLARQQKNNNVFLYDSQLKQLIRSPFIPDKKRLHNTYSLKTAATTQKQFFRAPAKKKTFFERLPEVNPLQGLDFPIKDIMSEMSNGLHLPDRQHRSIKHYDFESTPLTESIVATGPQSSPRQHYTNNQLWLNRCEDTRDKLDSMFSKARKKQKIVSVQLKYRTTNKSLVEQRKRTPVRPARPAHLIKYSLYRT